ncbi:acyltransferase [Bradyrhizobium sp. UFLA05-153]
MKQRIEGFDGIRAIAVILVYVQHANNFAAEYGFGEIGVWSFFVLSGFLIVRILFDARVRIEAASSGFGAEFRAFLAHRTARIFPIYYLVLALAAFFVAIGWHVQFYSFDWALSFWTYTTNWQIQHTRINPGVFVHLWSLSIEEQFYLFAAPLFLLTPSRFFSHALLAIIAVGAARSVQVALNEGFGPDSTVNFYMLALGGLAGLHARKVSIDSARRAFFTTTCLLLCSLLAELIIFHQDRKTILMVPLQMATMYVYIATNQKSALVRSLSIAPLAYLGRISYGFYLYHNFVRLAFISDALGAHLEFPNRVRVAIEFLLTLAIAAASWRFIERPILTSTHRDPSAAKQHGLR